MSESKALLRAIAEDPDDDTVRLAYADWLEEHGDGGDLARAQFIRVQIALARMADDDPAGPALVVRERLLLLRHGEEWASEIKGLGSDPVCRRGFIDEATVTLPQLLRHGNRLLDRAPVTMLRLTSARSGSRLKAQVQEVAGCPVLGRLRGLALVNLGSEGVELLGSQLLRGLRGLELHITGNRGAERLRDAPALLGLQRLLLWGSPLGDRGAQVLVAAPWFPGLTHLDLPGVGLGHKGLDALLGSLPPGLAQLDLLGNARIGDRGAARLAQAPEIARLKTLRLGATSLMSRGLEALVESPHVGGLTCLALLMNNLGPEGTRLVAHSPRLANLTQLDLCGNTGLGDEGVKYLAESPHLRRLSRLDLAHCGIGPAGAAALAASPNAASLTHLDLTSNRIGDQGAEALARSPYLRRLNDLDLHNTGIGPRGVAALSRSPILDHVIELGLLGNKIDQQAAGALVTSPHLGPHTTVKVGRKIRGIDVLCDRFPGRVVPY
jgi:uncharacterized protein (TIGR02996 family)